MRAMLGSRTDAELHNVRRIHMVVAVDLPYLQAKTDPFSMDSGSERNERCLSLMKHQSGNGCPR